MRILSTKIHGVLDYSVGLVMIASPWLWQFSDVYVATFTIIAMAVFIIVYSLVTNYELGAIGIISIRLHLLIDFFGGLCLIAAPWVLGFYSEVWELHVLFGVVSVIASLTTRAFTPAENTLKGRVKRELPRLYRTYE